MLTSTKTLFNSMAAIIVSGSDCRRLEDIPALAGMLGKAGSTVIAATDENDSALLDSCEHRYILPRASEIAASIIALGPLHILGYHLARKRDLDPNSFRNIVKTWR